MTPARLPPSERTARQKLELETVAKKLEAARNDLKETERLMHELNRILGIDEVDSDPEADSDWVRSRE